MDLKHSVQSTAFKRILMGLGVAFLVLVIFQLGVFVGFRKAAFSEHMGENYFRTFDGDDRGPGMMGFMMPPRQGFSGAHGTTGKIISIALPNIIVEDIDKVEKTVVIDEDATIRQFRTDLKPTDLKVGDSVIIIGAPNDKGQIEARLIRLVPNQP
jgi:hypothetical protein